MRPIKSCRKCGKEPELIKVGDMKELYIYRCKNCLFIPAKIHEGRLIEYTARKIWNKRN